ncbi:MAG: hypothetical protein NT102_00155 [Caldiserica bacterium]|nr:hypothetical protein [Caldisericota bacterium]
MRTRLLGIMIVVALLVSCASIQLAGAADTVPFVNVSIVDGYVGEYEEYHIRFLLGRDVKPEEMLSIVFDDNINRAGFRDIAAGDLSLDGTLAGASACWSGHILTVPVPVALSGGTVHELTILRSAMVQNPWKAMHVRLLLRDDAAGTTLVSNHYGISAVTHVSPVSLMVETPRTDRLAVLVRFRTGRTGALVGTPAVRFASPSSAGSDTISIRLSPALSRVWDQSGAPVVWFSTPGTILGPRRLQLVSTSDLSREQPDRYQKEATYVLDTSVGASTEVLVRLEFDASSIPILLTTDDFAVVWTSKEPTMVRIPLTGVPDPVPVDGGQSPELDTTAPLVTWKAQASAFSSRLVTVSIDIVEASLKQAFLETGSDGSLHTWLSVGHNELLLVNRSGIHGTIVATDKAGNTMRTPVDIPAPAAT